MKVLLIGGGISGRRFVESLIFTDYELEICGNNTNGKAKKLSQEYNMNFITINDLNSDMINSYKCIIVCTPPESRFFVLSRLQKLKYKNSLIIEKPFALSVKEANEILKLLSNNNFQICYSRRFEKNNYKINKSKDNYYLIRWPVDNSVKENKCNYFYHLLPHCIDWILMNFNINILNIDIVKKSNTNVILKSEKLIFEIKFEENSCQEKISVNEKYYEWPNYIRINQTILNLVINNKTTNKNDIINNIIIFEKILKEV